MKTLSLLSLLLPSLSLAAPTIYLAGDSTMTANGNNDGTAGWGVFLKNFTSLAIVNDAIAGRSARSFTREGRFTAMAASVKSGDYVIIEFGHNDGGSLTPTDNGRTDCSPVNNNYATTCSTVYKYNSPFPLPPLSFVYLHSPPCAGLTTLPKTTAASPKPSSPTPPTKKTPQNSSNPKAQP